MKSNKRLASSGINVNINRKNKNFYKLAPCPWGAPADSIVRTSSFHWICLRAKEVGGDRGSAIGLLVSMETELVLQETGYALTALIEKHVT